MEVVILAMMIGVLPAAIARSKGRGFMSWWVYGALLFIVALPHSILVSPRLQVLESRQLEEGMKKCPDCAELIKQEARVCRYCARELVA